MVRQTYAVECYWPGVNEREFRAAVERLTDDEAVSWISSFLIPDDEFVLFLAEASSPHAVHSALQHAGLSAERAVSCIHVTPHAPDARADTRGRSSGDAKAGTRIAASPR